MKTYEELIKKANSLNLNDAELFGAFYEAGIIKIITIFIGIYNDMPIVVFFPYFIPDNDNDFDKIYNFFLQIMDKVTQNKYIFIYINCYIDIFSCRYIFII